MKVVMKNHFSCKNVIWNAIREAVCEIKYPSQRFTKIVQRSGYSLGFIIIFHL